MRSLATRRQSLLNGAALWGRRQNLTFPGRRNPSLLLLNPSIYSFRTFSTSMMGSATSRTGIPAGAYRLARTSSSAVLGVYAPILYFGETRIKRQKQKPPKMEKTKTTTGGKPAGPPAGRHQGVPTNPKDASQYWLLGGAKCGHQMGPDRAGEIRSSSARTSRVDLKALFRYALNSS